MSVGSAERLPDAAGYAVWLLCCGHLAFEPGLVLPDRAVEAPVNALLLRGHGEVVLVDAGSGVVDHWWPGGADLDGALASAGTTAGEVTCLVLTHLDFDHAGGAVTAAAGRALPNAVAIAPAGAVASVPREHGRGVGAATALVAAYGDAGALREADPGEAIAPEIVLADAPGHRAGHCVVEIGGELLHLADVVHDARHVVRPEWDVTFDDDAELALDTRRRILGEAADRDVLVVASHIRGAARIGREGDGLRWLPA